MKRPDNMKRPEIKPRGPQSGTRTGPRARAAQDRFFADPYKRVPRPGRPDPARSADARPVRLQVSAGDGIRLDADVARVFRTAEAVNEVLRLVLRLAKVAAGTPRPVGRPFSPRDRAPGGAAPRTGRSERGERAERPAPTSRAPRFPEDR